MDGRQVEEAPGVKPGWSLLTDEDGDSVIMDESATRAVQHLPDEDAGPGRPVFACWVRQVLPIPIYDPDDEGFRTPFGVFRTPISYQEVAEGEFRIRGWVTGYEYATEWLNGGNPGGMLEPLNNYDPEVFEGEL